MNSISHNIKSYRKSHNLTQQQLADHIGVTHQTISNWESGRSMPNMDTLTHIAKILDTDINFLLYGKKADNSKLKKEIIRTLSFLAAVLIAKTIIVFITYIFNKNGIYPYTDIVAWYYYIPSSVYQLISPFSYVLRGVLAGQIIKYLGYINIDKNNKFYKYTAAISKILIGIYLMSSIVSDYMHIYTKTYKKFPAIILDIYRKPHNFFINYFWVFAIIGFVLELSKPFTNNKTAIPEYSPGRTNTIAKNIKFLRMDTGITQQQLADRLFVTRQTVSNWENGKNMPDISMLLNIAEIMETDLNKILYSENKITAKEKLSFVFTSIIICIMVVLHRGFWWSGTVEFITEYSIHNAGTIYLSLKQVVYNPVLYFTFPVFIIQVYKITGAFRYEKTFRYGAIIRTVIVLFMILTAYSYLPYFLTVDMKEAVRTAKPLLWLNYPDFSFVPVLPDFIKNLLRFIYKEMEWVYSVLGIVYELSKNKYVNRGEGQ